MSTEAPPPVSSTEDRTVAVLTYITIIGFIVALIIHSNKKTSLGSFHLRQGLGLLVTAIVLAVGGVILAMIPILGWIALLAAWVCFFIMWLLGLINAATGQQKPSPILGAQYQKWFSGAFA